MNPRLTGRLLVAALASSALLLAGCSSSGEETTDATATCTEFPDGPAAQSVTVTGEFGEEPEITFDKPLEAATMEAHVVTAGDGESTKIGDSVGTVVSIFSATTGELVLSQPADFVVGDENLYSAFDPGIECRPLGSRVVTVVPPDQLFGETGNESLGIGANETTIFVTDLKQIIAPPTVQPWTEDVPEVTFDDDGVPTIELPGDEAPEGLHLAILKEGDGATVAAGDDVTVDYQGVTWTDGKVFDQSYGAQPATFNTTGVITGFSVAVVGQKVGTQLLVSVPAQYAYPEGSRSQLAGQDLVFLIDIKAVNAPAVTPSDSAS